MKAILQLFMGVVAILGTGCGAVNIKLQSCPDFIAKSSAWDTIVGHGSFYSSSYTGLAFYRDELYVGSASGLQRFQGKEFVGAFRCRTDSWDGFENVVVDTANNNLWVYHFHTGTLLRFDGNTWQQMELPPKPEAYTRGDVSHGFVAFNTKNAFWMQGEDRAWRWNNATQTWTPESLPSSEYEALPSGTSQRSYYLASIAPIDEQFFVVMHSGLSGKDWGNGRYVHPSVPTPAADKIFQRGVDGRWQEIPGSQSEGLYTKRVVVGNGSAYAQTNDGRLFSFSGAGVTKLDTPGKIDALAISPNGSLMAAFHNLGIYELNTSWVKRFDSPYGEITDEVDAHLAEMNGRVAFTITWYEKGQRIGSALYISEGDKLVPISR